MRFYLYHNSFINGQTVFVCHPRGYPPTTPGTGSWDYCNQEQVSKLIPLASDREIRYFDMDYQLVGTPIKI